VQQVSTSGVNVSWLFIASAVENVKHTFCILEVVKMFFFCENLSYYLYLLGCSGKAGKNANFEALPDDWRERLLKKRKMMKST
jgi:E3 ubiquitin-protein ligase DOA10